MKYLCKDYDPTSLTSYEKGRTATLSWDLSEIRREFLRRGQFWDDFEVRSTTLEMEEWGINRIQPGGLDYFPLIRGLMRWNVLEGDWEPVPTYICRGPDLAVNPDHPEQGGLEVPVLHRRVSHILLDHLLGYQKFSPDIYDAPIVSNIRRFQSACAVYSFNVHGYVRFQLERGERRIQFRL